MKGENSINIDKIKTSYSMKIKNLFNLKFNNSNDIPIGLGIKTLENGVKNIFKKSNKKTSCDYNENINPHLNNINQTEINKKRNQTIFNKRVHFKDISIEKENDEQSYAFQNLVNLNNNNENNYIKYQEINDNNNNKSYTIQIKGPIHKKRLGKSPEANKFFWNEKKNYFNDDLKCKNDINKNNEYKNKTNDSLIDININKNNNNIKLNKNKKDKENENNEYHTSTQSKQRPKEKNIFEYDGDMETATYRYNSLSRKKNKNDSNKKSNGSNNTYKEKNKRKNSNINIINNLKSIKNDNYLKDDVEIIEPKIIKSYTYNYDPFCLGFFVSGMSIPIKEKSIIEDSINFLSPCGHKFCSLLFSISPEILYYYKNDNLEINDDMLKNISNLSFPLGVKICIECSFETNKMIQIPQQIFYNVMENNKGEKLYMCTKYYFIKIRNEDFKKNYKFDISSFFSEKISKNNKNYNNNYKNYLLTASRLLNSNSFLIPQSMTLLSKKPFLYPMSVCLNGFIASLVDDRIHLINHIVNEVPLPIDFGSQINFYLSPYSTLISLNNNINIYKVLSILNKEKQKEIFNNNCLSMEQLSYKKLFEQISIEHIIFIFSMVLLEQKIIFIHNNYEDLSQIIFSFFFLIYPFSWDKNQIFPILSLDTVDLLQNSKKFIAGMDEYLFSYIYKMNNSIFKNNNNVIIYNISKKCFIFYKNKKKMARKDILHEFKLFPFPEKINNFLMKELKKILNYIKSNQDFLNQITKNDNDLNVYKKLIEFKKNIEIETKQAFIKSIIMLIGDYNNYAYYVEEEKPLFNKEAFIESRKDKDFKNYLSQMVNNELFNSFLENQKNYFLIDKDIQKENVEDKNNINDINKNKVKNFDDIKYFIKFISKNQELLNNQQIIKNTNLNKMSQEIYSKAETICNKLTLINNSKIKDNSKNKKNENLQINKKKTNVLFSGKNYLEDTENNHKEENLENYLDEYKPFYTKALKDSKVSTEATTINTHFNSLKKSDIKESNSSNQNLVYIDINKIRKLSSNEQKKDKNEIIKKYLLVPYFLSFKGDDEDYVKEEKTEDIIINDIRAYKKRKKIKEKSPPFTTLITIIAKYIEYNSYKIIKNKMYIIKYKNNLKNDLNNDNNNKKDNANDYKEEVKLFKKKYFKEEVSEKDIININNIYGNDEEVLLINKCFKSLFLNKPEINNQHLALLKKLFLNFENREYFANLIIPLFFRKNKNIIYHKQLTINSFNIFSKIIKLSLENLNINDYNLGRLLTLACFIYYKIEKDNIIYLYSNFTFNKSDISQKKEQPYILWRTESFWIEFFNSEFENNNKEKEDIDEDNEKIKNEEDNSEERSENWGKKMYLIKTVIGVVNIMGKLKLEKHFIVNIVEKMILPVFINDFYYINRIMNLALFANNVN